MVLKYMYAPVYLFRKSVLEFPKKFAKHEILIWRIFAISNCETLKMFPFWYTVAIFAKIFHDFQELREIKDFILEKFTKFREI